MSKKSILDSVKEIDVRIIYLVQLLILIFPILRPIGIPISVGQTATDFYNTVESLPDGSVVLVHCGVSPAYFAELAPGLRAFLEHAFITDIKVIGWTSGPESAPMWDRVISTISIPSDIKYGEDWVFLGYIPGGETAVAGLANDIWATVPNDQYGNPIKDLIMMEDIRNAQDIAAYYDITGGTDTLERAIRQFNTPFNIPILLDTATGMIPATMPYYPQQVVGVLYGVRGGAEYEILLNKPWRGIAITDALTTLNLYIIVVIIFGNLSYFIKKQKNNVGENK